MGKIITFIPTLRNHIMAKLFVKSYIHFCSLYRKLTGKKLPGIGRVQRYLKKSFIFKVNGKFFYYDPSIEGSYDLLLIGKSNEPETLLFFSKLIPQLDSCNFCDVGASIGEMVIDVSRYHNVNSIYAFEPRKACSDVIKKSALLNEEKRITVFQNIVSLSDEEIEIYENPGGTSSGMYNTGSTKSEKVKSVRLDSILPDKLDNTIILVDVEGAEPLVLESGKNFIEKNSPLIIFEYNHISKEHFSLEDIANIVGSNYTFHRLKADASFDEDFSNSWNVIAIPSNSVFSKILL